MYKKHVSLRFTSLFLLITLLFTAFPNAVLADDSDVSLTSTTVEDTAWNVERTYDLAYKLYRDNENSGRRTGRFTWDTEGKARSWTYYNGIMMDAFLMLDEETFTSYVSQFYRANITTQGQVDITNASDNYYRKNELDSIPPARALFDLLRSPGISMTDKQKYIKLIDFIYDVMLGYERCPGAGENFKHKIPKDSSSSWVKYPVALDGLYMAQPYFMEIANALDDGTLLPDDFQFYSATEPVSADIYSDVVNRMLWVGENLYDPETRLYSHAWGPDTGLNGQFWLRSVGWYAAALADVISMLPDDYSEEKDALIDIEKRLFDGMMKYQDADTGMWYNVINYGPELAGSVSSNELESSGSALIAYAMMKSYVEGYLDNSYGKAGLRAFNGTAMNYLDEEGLHNIYISSGVETEPEGYLNKDYKLNEAKGAGPLIMASTYANQAAELYSFSDPSFKSGSLILSGEIGLNFYMDLPGDLSKYENSYMSFIVNDEEKIVPFDKNKKDRSKTCYGFTCYVNSLQMAEDIDAVFHYGEDNAETVQCTFSVLQYLLNIKEDPSRFSEETIDLADAIGNYGYYAQQYLGRIHNLEDKYEPMPEPTAAEYDLSSIISVTDSCQGSFDTEDSAVDRITAKLLLDSSTTLKIYLTMKSGFEGTPVVTVEGNEIPAVLLSDDKYLITITDIPAHKLATLYDIHVQADGDCAISISAMSYVNASLKNNEDDDAKSVMASLYMYYEKAMAYKESLQSA